MTDQSQLDASFGGLISDAFRNRGRHGILIGASIAYWIITLAIAAGLIFMAVGAFGDIMTMAERGPDSAMEMLTPSVMSLIPVASLGVIVAFIVLAAYEAGCLRWLVRGEPGGFLGLSFGADMWRVWLCYWMWLVVGLVLYGACIALVVAVAAVSSVASNEALTAALSLVAGIAGACVSIWIWVRLSPATATTVALQRFAFFDAWKATKGRFWMLLGVFLVVWVAYIVASQVIQTLGVIAFMGPLFSMIATSGGMPDPEGMTAAFVAALASPGTWIGLAILFIGSIVLGILFYVVLFGVSARAALVAKQEGRI
jgi:hypothetical protein